MNIGRVAAVDAFAFLAATPTNSTGTANANAPQLPTTPVTTAAASNVTSANTLAVTDRQNASSLRKGSATSVDRT